MQDLINSLNNAFSVLMPHLNLVAIDVGNNRIRINSGSEFYGWSLHLHDESESGPRWVACRHLKEDQTFCDNMQDLSMPSLIEDVPRVLLGLIFDDISRDYFPV